MNGRIQLKVTLFLFMFTSQSSYFADTAVLDPALYLYPSPPINPSSGGSEDRELWTRTSRSTKFQNVEGATSELSKNRTIETVKKHPNAIKDRVLDTKESAILVTQETTTVRSTTTEQESMENAETFWPRLRSIDHVVKQLHVPVTFTLTGNYGGYSGAGVIGNTYASVGGTGLFSYGKSALAGTGYGNYGSSVRVYGGNSSPAWSGWGNGKWGHYGKG